EFASAPPARFGRDAVFRSATGGGWTCVCFGDGVQAFQQTLIARIIGIDPAGSVTDDTDIPVLADLARRFTDRHLRARWSACRGGGCASRAALAATARLLRGGPSGHPRDGQPRR